MLLTRGDQKGLQILLWLCPLRSVGGRAGVDGDVVVVGGLAAEDGGRRLGLDKVGGAAAAVGALHDGLGHRPGQGGRAVHEVGHGRHRGAGKFPLEHV